MSKEELFLSREDYINIVITYGTLNKRSSFISADYYFKEYFLEGFEVAQNADAYGNKSTSFSHQYILSRFGTYTSFIKALEVKNIDMKPLFKYKTSLLKALYD